MIDFWNARKRHAMTAIKDTEKNTVLRGRIDLEVRKRFYRILKMDAALDHRRVRRTDAAGSGHGAGVHTSSQV
jgi:hypothetical protein